ncbi:hypothetical protein J122_721 [Marinobacter excellens LAMA 842]|uniref:Uncharacterized protein n=1 Tax=Marinobacter excellens LAMA 842 TaxID=1306954 RepID=A0A137SHD2_9GAMM|nr:hypothetical protein J122_721 [Marinobacter excellens LAMA 842]
MKPATVVFKRNGYPTVTDRIICGQRLRIEKQGLVRRKEFTEKQSAGLMAGAVADITRL